jgi:hypothetical protein
VLVQGIAIAGLRGAAGVVAGKTATGAVSLQHACRATPPFGNCVRPSSGGWDSRASGLGRIGGQLVAELKVLIDNLEQIRERIPGL